MMKYCKKCGISTIDDSVICPLCQRPLTGGGQQPEPVFPYIPLKYSRKKFYIKIAVLVLIAGCVICAAVNYIIESSLTWSLYVMGGAVTACIVAAVSLPKISNIPKSILYQSVLCSVLSFIWDMATGGHGWSVGYVIPFICAGTNTALIAVFFAMRMRIDDIAFYYCVNLVYGALPVWFILGSVTDVMYPSLISAVIGVVSFAAFVIFYWRNIVEVIKSKFHI